MNLYHISEKNLDNKILYPRIPNNYMTKNGYEDNRTPRVSFSKSIDGCLVALSANIKGKEFYIHEPIDNNIKIKNITNKDVPDANLTDEVWVLEPVKIKVTGKIKVLDSIDEPLIYKYGNNEASLYRWKWKSISLTESVEDIINYYNGYKQGIFEYTKEFEDERIKILKETKDNSIIESLGWIPGVPINSNNILRIETLNRSKNNHIKEVDFTQDEVLNDKNKFYDWVLNTDETIEDLFDKDTITESYILNDKDLILNIEQWKKEKNHNILYITGLSGSGKTTLAEKYEREYKASMFEIDGIEHNYDSSNKGLLDKAKEKYPEYKEAVENKWKGIDEEKRFYLISKIYNFIISEIREDYKTLYIIEGIQLFEFINIDSIKGKPLIIKGTSVLNSILQRFKRNSGGKINWIDELKNEFPQLVNWYIKSEKRLNNYRKNINEEYIEESYIFNKKDLYINFDKFESGESNMLFITGLSASGKSTLAKSLASKYKAEIIELDRFEVNHNYTERNFHHIGDIYIEYFNKRKDLREPIDRIHKMDIKEFTEEFNKFFNYIINYCNKNKDKKFIIEGLQIYRHTNSDKIKGKPTILIGTSVSASIINMFKRTIEYNEKETLKEDLLHLPRLLKWYFNHEADYKQFKRELLKEEYIEEKLSYKERQKLKDSDFGLPKLRKYPLHDEAHIRAAIKFFNYVDKKYEKELAENIIRRMKELNLYDIEIGKDNKFYKYYQEAIEPEKIKENFEYIIEEANKRNEEPIYILLTKTGSTMSKTISTVLGDFYTHVSLSFDLNMDKVYAFDKNGFIIEELQKTYKNQFGNIPMAIYCIFINKDSLQIIKNRIDDMLKDKKKYHYNYLGALGLAFEKPVHINNAMFCSEFVDQLLKLSGNDITGKNSGLVSPQDFKRSKFVYKIYEGTLNKYSIIRAQKNLSKLKSRIFTEGNIEYINEMLNISKDSQNDWHTYANQPIGRLYDFGPCDQGLHNYLKVSPKPNLIVQNNQIIAPHDIRYGDELTLSEDDMEYIIRKMYGGVNKAIPIDHPDNKHPNYTKSNLSEFLDESYIEESSMISGNGLYYRDRGIDDDFHIYANINIKKDDIISSKKGIIYHYIKTSNNPNVTFDGNNFIVINNINKGEEMTISKKELSSIKEAKEFPVQFDKDGSLIIKNSKKLNFEEEDQKSHKLLLSYEKTNNYEGMKYELSKLWYMNIELERRIYNSNRDESKLNEYTRVRARILNDFNKYIKLINKVEKDFNFSEYYEESPFNDGSMKLRKSTLDYLGHYLKQIVKSILI